MLTEYLANGVSVGIVYGMVGLGLVVIYRGSRIVNFAHGSIGAISGWVWYRLWVDAGWPYLAAAAVAIAASCAVGVVTYVLVISRLRHATVLARLIATVGVSLFLQYLLIEQIGDDILFAPLPLTTSAFSVGALVIGWWQIVVVIVAVTAAALLALFLRRTALGRAMRASASDREALAVLGFEPRRMELLTWTIGSGLAGLGAVMVLANSTIQPASTDFLLMRALVAAVVGGLMHPGGALIGGLLVGITEALTRWQFTERGAPEMALFVLLVAALVFLPDGIVARVRGGARRPRMDAGVADVVVPGRHRAPAVAPRPRGAKRIPTWTIGLAVLALALGGARSLSQFWAFTFSIGMVYVLVAASLVLLVGYAGQISLGHAGLLGLGAFTTAYLMSNHEVGFPAAMLAAIGVTMVGSLLIGLPAIRVRGMQLAVVTLVFGLMLSSFAFQHRELSRGSAGVAVPDATFAGVSLDDDRTKLQALVLAVALVLFVVVRSLRARAGPAFAGMRLNERYAQASGVAVDRYKLAAFVGSAAIAGLAGAFYALLLGQVSHTAFPLSLSLTFVVLVVMGGLRSLTGALVVAWLFGVMPEALRGFEDWVPLLGSVGVIVALVLQPTGAGPAMHDLVARIRVRVRT